jgi:hypothetical protein
MSPSRLKKCARYSIAHAPKRKAVKLGARQDIVHEIWDVCRS